MTIIRTIKDINTLPIKKKCWFSLMIKSINKCLNDNIVDLKCPDEYPMDVIIGHTSFSIGVYLFNVMVKHAGWGELRFFVNCDQLLYFSCTGWLERKTGTFLQYDGNPLISAKLNFCKFINSFPIEEMKGYTIGMTIL